MSLNANGGIDLNIPFVECINDDMWHFDVSDINENAPSSSNSQNNNSQQLQLSPQGNNNTINETQPTFTSQVMGRRNKELSNAERKLIVQQLVYQPKDGVLPKGAKKAKAEEWNVSRWTIRRLWKGAKQDIALGTIIDVRSKKSGRVGRKPRVFNMELFKTIKVDKRTTIRGLAHAMGYGHSTIYRSIKEGKIKSHTNSMKPKLSIEQKHKRLDFILSQIIPPSVHQIPKFSLMYNVVHIDEKYFKMSKECQRFYLFHDDSDHEEEPYRCVQNKNFIAKVMFLAAIARPHIATDGEVLWDGKIGIFPFTEQYVTVRNSANRPAGTIEERAIARVTRDVVRQKLIEEVLPAIRANWPTNGVKDIFIQQDNAKPHIYCNDAAFMEAATQGGFNIRLVCQPASSPDMNILDLGFFNSIQSIQFKTFPKDVSQLVSVVKEAYAAYDSTILNYTWIHFHLIMLKVLKVKGGNNYSNPHMGKKKLDRLGLLPQQLDVPIDLIESTKQILEDGIIDLNVPLQEED